MVVVGEGRSKVFRGWVAIYGEVWSLMVERDGFVSPATKDFRGGLKRSGLGGGVQLLLVAKEKNDGDAYSVLHDR